MYGRLLRVLCRVGLARFARAWRRAVADPRAAQHERLHCILRRHAGCEFGQTHGFADIADADAYRARVPVTDYEGMRPAVDRMRAGERNVLVAERVRMFAVTSGTTGAPKFLPVTRSMNLEQHAAHLVWMHALVGDHPAVTEGKLLTVVSPAEEGRTTGGIPYGSATGLQYTNQALPVRRRHAVPYEAMCVHDYDARHYVLLAFALSRNVACATSTNPSTLVLLAERMRAWAEPLVEDLDAAANGFPRLRNAPGLSDAERDALQRRLRPSRGRVRALRERLHLHGTLVPRIAWPKLAALCTWHGGAAGFYLGQLVDPWGTAPTRGLGLRASEGVFTIPLSDATPEGVLAVGGHFVEFLPGEADPGADARTLLAHELEVGERYRLVVTTSAGLYRYDLADVVEVTGFHERAPVMAFLHRAGAVLSITGEKVTESQAAAAARRAAPHAAGCTLTLRLAHPPRYLAAVEPEEAGHLAGADAQAALARAFDQALSAENLEYKAKRASGRLASLEVLVLPAGTYAAHRRRAVDAGRPEWQVKPPHLVRSEQALREELLGETS